MTREKNFKAIAKLNPTEIFYFTLDDLFRNKMHFAYPEHYYFIESTGLKDKNGKEIYEGDIVNLHFDGGEYEAGGDQPCKVFFEDFEWKMRSEDDEWGENFNELNSEELEIIGNIYQNPELLK